MLLKPMLEHSQRIRIACDDESARSLKVAARMGRYRWIGDALKLNGQPLGLPFFSEQAEFIEGFFKALSCVVEIVIHR